MTEDEFRELIEMGAQIQELTRHPGWQYFIDRAVVNVSAHQRRVLSGSLDPDEYRRMTGWLEGAGFVMGVPAMVDREIAEERARQEEAQQ